MFHYFMSTIAWNFFTLFTDSIIIQVTENTNIFAKDKSLSKKTPPAAIESFLMTLFD